MHTTKSNTKYDFNYMYLYICAVGRVVIVNVDWCHSNAGLEFPWLLFFAVLLLSNHLQGLGLTIDDDDWRKIQWQSNGHFYLIKYQHQINWVTVHDANLDAYFFFLTGSVWLPLQCLLVLQYHPAVMMTLSHQKRWWRSNRDANYNSFRQKISLCTFRRYI